MTASVEDRSIKRQVEFDASARYFLLMIALCSFFFQNGVYLFLCLIALFAIIRLLCFYAIPNILAFAMMMHWVQVFSFVLWMNYNSWEIDHFSTNAGVAILLSIGGIILMSAIFSKFLNKIRFTREYLVMQSKLANKKKLITLYLLSSAFLSTIGFVFGNTSGLAQILTTISTLKWIFFSWYAFSILYSKENKALLIVITVLEFLMGTVAYFSAFKGVIYILIITLLTFVTHVNLRHLFRVFLTVTLLFFMGLIWTAVKGEYRNFLNKGQSIQSVMVTKTDAYEKLSDQVASLDSKRLENSLDDILYRLQYIFHFAKAMDRVPAAVPHEHGKLWWQNLTFNLMPRLLFPNKPIYEATPKTIKYTGIFYAGYDKGTSFSLGYFAESYVDFGPVFMFLPLVLLALLITLLFKTLMIQSHLNLFLRFSVINVCFFEFILFEADGTYVLGRILMSFLVFIFLGKTLFPRLQKWLYA